jgi:hypothetical protein
MTDEQMEYYKKKIKGAYTQEVLEAFKASAPTDKNTKAEGFTEEVREAFKGATFIAATTQVGGNHYKDMPIPPREYIKANNIGWDEGNAIKYISRWREKNGIQDLEKAIHYIQLLIEEETNNG